MASALWFVHLGLVMSTGSGLTTGDLSARRHVKEKKISWDIFPSWLFRSFFCCCCPFLFFLPILMIFSDSSHLFFFVYLFYPAWAGTLCRYMIGLCVCLDSLDSSTASTLFFCLSFGIFFLFFSLRFQIPHLIREKKKLSKITRRLPFIVPCRSCVQQPKANFRFKNFHFPAHFFFSPPLFLSHFSNMSASIRSTCQGSHSMLIMCARPPLG